MKHAQLHTIAKALLLSIAFALQACAPTQTTPNSQVAMAFEASGAVAVKPYTRTIFSNNDF